MTKTYTNSVPIIWIEPTNHISLAMIRFPHFLLLQFSLYGIGISNETSKPILSNQGVYAYSKITSAQCKIHIFHVCAHTRRHKHAQRTHVCRVSQLRITNSIGRSKNVYTDFSHFSSTSVLKINENGQR